MADSKFNYLCFNELTLNPICKNSTDTYSRIEQYAKTIREAQEKIGTRKIRYATDLSSVKLGDTSLRDFCSKYRTNPVMIAILSTFTMPQIRGRDEQKVGAFSDTVASINDGKEELSDGLAAAYVYDIPSIGFASNDFWNEVIHKVNVISGNEQVTVDWPCLTKPNHLLQNEFLLWMQTHSQIELIPTKLPFSKKTISLSNDHGKDILLEHATTLCHNEYVEGVVCSLPYKPHCRSYVLKVSPEGFVDVVLSGDDRGLSMRVKTTGRNIRETKAIADLLQSKFSK